jgi:hypothetical protein
MTDTQRKQCTIILTGRRPVLIDEDEWPLIATASGDDCGISDPARYRQAIEQGQADEYSLHVRQHADGRVIVYGTYTESVLGSGHEGLTHAGYVFTPDEARPVEYMIQSAGSDLGVPDQLVADCIADLPAEKLQEAWQ